MKITQHSLPHNHSFSQEEIQIAVVRESFKEDLDI